MSLKVWLPLNGDLENRGASNITISGGTIDNNGKIGRCYLVNKTNYITITQSIPATAEWSVSFWMKLPASMGNATAWENMFNFPTINADTGANSSSAINWASYHNVKIWDDSNHQWFWASPSSNFSYDKWHCWTIAHTLNGNGVRGTIYIDGNLINTYNNTTHQLKIRPGNITIGSGISTGGFYLNDFRIYDHCLSPLEVKEISQGLVLHYPLTRFTNTKLPSDYQELEYIEGAGAAYINTDYKFNPETDSCKVIFKGNDTANTGMIFASSGGKYFWLYYYGSSGIRVYADNGSGQQGIAGISSDLNKHTAEFKNKHYYIDGVVKGNLSNTYTETTNQICLFSYGGGSYAFKGRIYYIETSRNNIIQKMYIPAKRLSDSKIGMYEVISNTFFSSATSTEFTAGPNITTTMIADCSGFEYNGTLIGTPLFTADTGRYGASLSLNGVDQCVQMPNFSTIIKDNTFTMSVWFKKITGQWSSKSWETIFGGPGGFELECKMASNNTNYIHPYSWGGGSTGTPNAYSFAYPLDEWNHLVMVRTSSDTKYYLNGELKVTGSAGSIPSGNYFIGAWNTTTGQNYKGYVSDVRIYVTALSEADIKRLYNTPYSIDNLGKGHGYEYQEGSNLISVQKNGIIKEDELNEIITLPDGSMWLPIMVHDNKSGTNLFSSSDDFSKLVYHNDDCWAEFPLINSAPRPDNSKYEFLVYQRPTDDANFQRFRWTQTNDPLNTTAVAGLTTLEGGTANGGGICKRNSYTYLATGSSNWWNACGSWTQFGTGIPGFNGVTVNRELLLFMRVSSNNYRDIKNSFIIGTSFLEI